MDRAFTRRRALAGLLASTALLLPIPGEARLHGGISVGSPQNLPVNLSLNNINASSSYATPLLTIVHAFADGDVPVGGSVTMLDSTSNPVTVQMDQVARWPSGCVRMAALTFKCAETWAASASKNYNVNSSATAPNNTVVSATWGGTTKAAIIAAFKAASAFQFVFTGFDAGAATYDMDVTRILNSYSDVTAGWGASYPRGGYEFTKMGPACVEMHFWEYIRNQATGNTHGYVRCDAWIKMAAPGGPYDIDARFTQPNMWNTVPLSSVAEQFNNKQRRFAAVVEIFNSGSRVGACGGPNDLRATTVTNANFNTSTNQLTAAYNSFFPQTGVAFSSTGSLPAGNMAASTIYWPAYVGQGANPYLMTQKLYVGQIENGQYNNWVQSQTRNVGDIDFNTTNNLFYICTTAGTTSNTGTGPTGTGSGIADGSVVWTCISLQFTSTGSGTITAYPVYATFPAGMAMPIVDQSGNPTRVGSGAFPDIYPGHDFAYLTTKTKFVPPYNAVTLVTPGASVPLNTNFSPSQATGGLPTIAIDATGDGDGDQRIGYVSEYAVGSLYQPAEPRYLRSTIQFALSVMQMPINYMFDESGGHPFIGNNGTNNSGTPYTFNGNALSAGLIPLWNENNRAGNASAGVAARGDTWSRWDNADQNQGSYFGQYYFPMSHYPCAWQIPWLKTGRSIFLEQGLTNANSMCFMTYLGTKTISGTTYRCLIGGDISSDQLRAFGWGRRSLCQAMYIVPDDHPLQNYIRDLYDTNAKYAAAQLGTLAANQAVLGFFPNSVEQGVAGGVGGWAPWMGFFLMLQNNMEQWRGGLTTQEAANKYWGQVADYHAAQWKIWDPAIDPNAVNYASLYRQTYGPTPGDWTTCYTNPSTLNAATYTTGNSQIAPYPSAPYDIDAPGNIIAADPKAHNWYGHMMRAAAKIRTLSKPSDTLAANVLAQLTANIKNRTGKSTEGGNTWGYVNSLGQNYNNLVFAIF